MRILTRLNVSTAEYAELKKLAIDRGVSLADLLTQAVVTSPLTAACFIERTATTKGDPQ